MNDSFDRNPFYLKDQRPGNRRLRKTLEQVRRHSLPNGMTVLTLEDHSLPIVTSMLWYRVGSRYELPGTRGISHFLEHMMFKGSSRFGRGEIDSLTSRLGGINNAFTSQDYTAYFFSFASDRWQAALEIEADRMENNLFEAAEFELEKQVVLEELKMELDSPWGQLRQAVDFCSFENHPYRFPIVGLTEDLESLKLEEMVDFYKRFYRPNNSILVLVGDFGTEKTMEAAGQLFGTIPASPLPQVNTRAETGRPPSREITVQQVSHVTRMLVSLPFPSRRQPEFFSGQILESILGEGKLCRLYPALVESELVSFLETETSETYDPYRMLIRLELNEGVSPQEVRGRLFDELDSLCQKPVSAQQMERAKNQLACSFLYEMETTFDQANQLGLLEILDRFESLLAFLNEVEAVTPDTVLETARRYCSPELAMVGTLLKEGRVTVETD